MSQPLPRKISSLSLAIATSLSLSQATATDIAWDMVNTNSQNLSGFSTSLGTPFTDNYDAFGKYQRGVSVLLPRTLMDDSLSIYPSDSFGLIRESNTQEFFGAADTINSSNSGDLTATWVFDISSATTDFLEISLDMAAMGDFETSDKFLWTASIDGGAAFTVFEPLVDDASSLSYTLEGGISRSFNDPMTFDGNPVNNVLSTISKIIEAKGNQLTLTATINTNGGDEAVAFQNLVISESSNGPDDGGSGDGDGNGEGNGGVTLIHDIQGSGETSPLVGQTVTIEGIVVGDFQNDGSDDNGDLNGFFVQEESSDYDANDSTSEGLFIYAPGISTEVAVSDKVTVTGTISEYNGSTQLTAGSVALDSSNNTLPPVTDIHLPISSLDEFETVESMRVRFPQALQISEYYNFDRFGEIVLAKPISGESRAMTPTAMEIPGSATYIQRRDTNALSRITLDDGRTSQNPDPALHPNGNVFNLDNRFRGGDTVDGATGVMTYSFGMYRLQPTQGANHTEANPRPLTPPAVNGNLKVASFNVLNYFTSLDNAGSICGPSGGMDCRGADDDNEFTRQRSKIIAAIHALNADVVGLIEIENNATAAVSDLITGLNGIAGADTYAAINTGTIGDDAIKVALIYKPAEVSPSGNFAVLDNGVIASFNDGKNRPVLAQTFKEKASNEEFTVAVNHLKSKGSDCDALGDPDQNDGQGNCNLTRTAAANALATWLATKPTGTNDDDVLIIGDLNAYDQEAPITALKNSGYTDLLARDIGAEAYSYVFSGQYGYLDYALSNSSLSPQVGGVNVWHINADEPDMFDYDTSFKKDAQDALFESNAFRSSDHDPVIIGLNLASATPASAVKTAITTLTSEINNGVLSGYGNSDQIRQLYVDRVESYLNNAKASFDANDAASGCASLSRIYRYIDGSGRDWVIVNSGQLSELAGYVSDALDENSCR